MALRKVQGGVIADNAITSDKIAVGAISVTDIADGSITSAKLAAGAVTPPTPTIVSDQANTSTGYFDVPAGTTAQRPVSPNVGYIRFNTDLGNLEQFTGSAWGSIAPPPSISSVSPITFNGNAGTTFTINGTAFGADVTVKFITNDGTEYTAASVSRISASQLTATTPQDFTVANEPLDVKVIQGSGTAIVENVIDCGGVPIWTTSSGSLGSVNEKASASLTVLATDPEDGSVTYNVENGSTLPSGLSLNASSGVISGTMPDVSSDTTYNFTLGATDAGSNKTTRSFSITSYAGDDYWSNTLALFKANSTGAQNSITDSSSNALSLTPNGNVHQSSFSPFNTGWSGYFDNDSSQYLTITDPSNHFDFGSGDFTIESWCYANSFKNNFARPWGFAVEGTPTGSGIGLFYTTDKNGQVIYIRNQTAGDTAVTINSPTGKWYHLALVRDGNVIRLYQNGIQVGFQNISGALYYNNRFRIGASNTTSPTEYWDGYISNVRIVKGTCLYAGGTTFTPPTSKLTAVSGTVLLTCQDSWFKDNSAIGMTVSAVNGTGTRPINPFGTTTLGGSYGFDDVSDYFSAPSSSLFNYNSTDLTLEGWFYLNSHNSTGSTPLSALFGSSSSGSNHTFAYVYTNGKIAIGINGINEITSTNTGVVSLKQWYHVAYVKQGSTTTIYLNGVNVGSGTTGVWTTSDRPFYVGSSLQTDGQEVNGYITNVRLVKGTAVYTGNFTPPSIPLTAISGTALLAKGENLKAVDATGNFSLIDLGNSTVSSGSSKYNGAAMYFDGDGDAYAINIPNYNYNVTNWLNTETVTRNGTIEAWVNLTSYQSSPTQAYLFRSILSRGDTYINFGVIADGRLCWYWYNSSSGQKYSYSTGTVALNSWTHVAVTFTSGNVYFWINGTASGSASFDGVAYGASARTDSGGNLHYIGQVWGRATSSWHGYIDELRITPGYARYTSNFTTPARAMSTFPG
jgi:Concanavalin A-like lectin/glucanases superfamily/Putative Ig domain/IPT/TIG domain